MSDTTTPAILATTTTRGTRLHLDGCKNSASGRPVAIADFAAGIAASCCKPKAAHLDAARQALGMFADPDTLPEILAAQAIKPEPDVEAIASAATVAATGGTITDDMRLVEALADLGGCDVTRAQMTTEYPQHVWVAAETHCWVTITRDEEGEVNADRYTVTDAGYIAIGRADASGSAKPKRRRKNKATDVTGEDATTDVDAGGDDVTEVIVPGGDTRWHDANGKDVREYPGIIRFRRVRATGALAITVRVAEYHDLDEADGKYAAICITHGDVNRADVRRTANYSLPSSHEWCGGCAEAMIAN